MPLSNDTGIAQLQAEIQALKEYWPQELHREALAKVQKTVL